MAKISRTTPYWRQWIRIPRPRAFSALFKSAIWSNFDAPSSVSLSTNTGVSTSGRRNYPTIPLGTRSFSSGKMFLKWTHFWLQSSMIRVAQLAKPIWWKLQTPANVAFITPWTDRRHPLRESKSSIVRRRWLAEATTTYYIWTANISRTGAAMAKRLAWRRRNSSQLA